MHTHIRLSKRNSFAQLKFQSDNFAQMNGPKMPYIHENFEELCQIEHCNKKVLIFSCFAFKSNFFLQILKKIVQPCDLTTPAFSPDTLDLILSQKSRFVLLSIIKTIFPSSKGIFFFFFFSSSFLRST